MRSSWRPAWPAAVLLLATACEHTEAERAQRALVERARERNASVGLALAVLALVAGRLLLWAVTSDEQRRRPLRPHRMPPLLVLAATGSQVTALLLFGLVGAAVGYTFGPTPPGAGLDELGVALSFAMLLPFWAAAVVCAPALLRLARRVPQAGTPTLVAAGCGHVFAALAGGVFAWYTRPLEWRAFGALLTVASLVAAYGYGYASRVRRRVQPGAPRAD